MELIIGLFCFLRVTAYLKQSELGKDNVEIEVNLKDLNIQKNNSTSKNKKPLHEVKVFFLFSIIYNNRIIRICLTRTRRATNVIVHFNNILIF